MRPDPKTLAAAIIEEVTAIQRKIHADPEIGFDTVRTAALAVSPARG